MFDLFKSREEKMKDDRPKKGIDKNAQKSQKTKKEDKILEFLLRDELDEDE